MPNSKNHEAVVALAEELNYSRAADRVGISQPALTKQIIELEKSLGYALFERDRKHVVLTQAGEVYVREARLALMHSERAVQLGRAADHGKEHIVTVGRSQYIDPDLVSGLLAVQLPLYPNLRVQLESSFALDLVRSVAGASLDVAIVSGVPETTGITQAPLVSEPLHVGLRATHPAARLDRVHMRDLDGTNWAVFSKRVQPLVYDTLFRIAERERIQLKELHHIISAEEALPLVADHDCITFATASTARQIHSDQVVFRPLDHDELLLQTSVIMRGGNESRLVNSFVMAFLRQFQRKSPQRELFSSGERPGYAAG